MKKNAFTLIELLAVIALLAILILLTVTTVSRQVKQGKSDIYQEQLNTIKLAAQMWGSENKNTLSNYSDCVTITLGYLKDAGYVDQNIKNPITDKKFKDNEVFVNITPKTKGYSYEASDDLTKVCGVIDFNE